jgi:hypothetical protein
MKTSRRRHLQWARTILPVLLVTLLLFSLASCATSSSSGGNAPHRHLSYDVVDRSSSTVIGRLNMPKTTDDPQEEAAVQLELFSDEPVNDKPKSCRFPAHLTKSSLYLSVGNPALDSVTQVRLHRSGKSGEWSGEIVSLGDAIVTTPVRLVPRWPKKVTYPTGTSPIVYVAGEAPKPRVPHRLTGG